MASPLDIPLMDHAVGAMTKLDRLAPATLSTSSLCWLLAITLVVGYTSFWVATRSWYQGKKNRFQPFSQMFVQPTDAPVAGCKQSHGPVRRECVSDDVTEGHYDAIIVGAGVAGAALAYTLGKDGRRVLVLERDLREPDRIVGELLQPGGLLKLQELGLGDCVNGIDSQVVEGYVIFKGQQEAKLQYPTMENDRAEMVPMAGRGFHNGRFLQAMRRKAAALPGVTLVEATVSGLVQDGDVVHGVKFKQRRGARPKFMCSCPLHKGQMEASQAEAREPEGAHKDVEVREVRAPLTFVCDGCYSNLRRAFTHSEIQVPSSFVGLLLEDCPLPHPNYGHVVIADPSPILFYPVSSTEVRCLVDVPGSKVPSAEAGHLQEYLLGTVLPQLPEKLRAPFKAAVEKEGNAKSMRNQTMPAVPDCRQGALLMGDAFNMRHPLTGGGMTVALSDIAVLSKMLNALPSFNDTLAVQRCTTSFFMRRKPIASTINTLACALYKVFCASKDKAMTEMRQACFDYLSLGGVCASGPVSLLSGLNEQPLSLVFHFFAVAFFGVSRLLLPFPTISNFFLGINLIKGASEIIFPIIRGEGFLQMFFPALFPSYYMASRK